MPHVAARGADLYYEVEGDRGSPVLLVMGLGVPGRLWKGQVRVLREHHRVAWFDNEGTGDTVTRGRGFRPVSTADMARHGVAVLDHLGWDRAHVVGVSMGGMIAQELALLARDRLHSLTLIATHAGGLTRTLPSPRALGLFAKGFLGPRRGRARALQQLVFTQDWLSTQDKGRLEAALDRKVASSTPVSSRVNQITSVMRHRAARRLPRLAGLPTLIVKPARDVLVRPAESDRLHRLIPGSRLVVLPEVGHGVLYQAGDEVNELLLEHFSSVDRPDIPRGT